MQSGPQAGQQPVYPTATPGTPYPAPKAQEKEGSPYDFFLESKQPKKATGLPTLGGGSPLKKIIIVAVLIFAVLGILAVILSSTRSKSNAGVNLTTIVVSQQEIIRISGLGVQKLDAPSLKNFAATAEATTKTSQQEVITFIGATGGKIDPKVLAAATDPRNDRTLDAAEASSTYDTAFKATMDRLLTDYNIKLEQLSDRATLQSQRTLIDKNINSAELLKKMLDQ
jgi:hypothetical protein